MPCLSAFQGESRQRLQLDSACSSTPQGIVPETCAKTPSADPSTAKQDSPDARPTEIRRNRCVTVPRRLVVCAEAMYEPAERCRCSRRTDAVLWRLLVFASQRAAYEAEETSTLRTVRASEAPRRSLSCRRRSTAACDSHVGLLSPASMVLASSMMALFARVKVLWGKLALTRAVAGGPRSSVLAGQGTNAFVRSRASTSLRQQSLQHVEKMGAPREGGWYENPED
jgi:hypothetical protein